MMSKKKLVVFAIKLFEDENTPQPRLKLNEEYMHSWATKDGDIICHDDRRNKIYWKYTLEAIIEMIIFPCIHN